MANSDNQSQRFIYIRSLKEKVPCTEQQFQEFYREATRIRKKEQYYHRCKCPKQFIWACDGDCENCEHHLGYGLLSLDGLPVNPHPMMVSGDVLSSFHSMPRLPAAATSRITASTFMTTLVKQYLHGLSKVPRR